MNDDSVRKKVLENFAVIDKVLGVTPARLRAELDFYDAAHCALSWMKITSKKAGEAHTEAWNASVKLLNLIATDLGVDPFDPREGSVIVRDRIEEALKKLEAA